MHDDKGAPCSILIVDDDATLRERLGRAFKERGFEPRLAADYAQAVACAEADSPEMALIDLRMPGQNGLTLLQALRRIDPATQVVVLTGYGSIATAVDAMRMGARGYLPKPADVDDILAAFSGRSSEAADHAAPSLARTEWEHINRVLSDCHSNITLAARRLGVHRRSLQRKLQKYPPAI